MPDDRYRTDCHFYQDVKESNARIPTCGYRRVLGHCPCSPQCRKYISEADADALIRAHVDAG